MPQMTQTEFKEIVTKQVEDTDSVFNQFMLYKNGDRIAMANLFAPPERKAGNQKFVKEKMFYSKRIDIAFTVKSVDQLNGPFTVEFHPIPADDDLHSSSIDLDHQYSYKPRYLAYEKMSLTKSDLKFELFMGEIEHYNYVFSIDYFSIANTIFDLNNGIIDSEDRMMKFREKRDFCRADVNVRFNAFILDQHLLNRILKNKMLFSEVRCPSDEFRYVLRNVADRQDIFPIPDIISKVWRIHQDYDRPEWYKTDKAVGRRK